MKTSVNMVRKMGNFEVIQRTKDGFFDANHLLQQWNTSIGTQRRQMDRFLKSSKTEEFIKEIQTIENQQRAYMLNADNQIVKYQKGNMTKRGKNPDKVWMHPYLYIDFAMWLNPRFKYHVIKFVYDQLIEYRTNAGDLYKGLTDAVSIFPDVNYSQLAKGLNHIIFGKHERGIRQLATPQQLQELNDLQKQLAFAVNMNFIKSYSELIENMRQIYFNKHYKF